MMMRALIVLGAFVSGLVVGCASPTCWGDETAPGSCESGPCRDDNDCASAMCVAGTCEPPCSTHTDCASGTYCVEWTDGLGRPHAHCDSSCGVGPDGRRFTLVASDTLLVCQSGRPTQCSVLFDPGPYCGICGCPTGEVCLSRGDCADGGCSCRTPMPLGSNCSYHEDCESANCSGTGQGELEGQIRRCQLPAGSPCDPAMPEACFWCEEGEPGDFRCQQSCSGDQCSICVGYTDMHEFTCRMGCALTRTCPTGYQCQYLDSVDMDACMPVR